MKELREKNNLRTVWIDNKNTTSMDNEVLGAVYKNNRTIRDFHQTLEKQYYKRHESIYVFISADLLFH